MIERETPEVPPAEGDEPKEVFAFFGLCAYHCQVLEQGLLNLLVPLRLHGLTQLSPDDIEEAYVANERKTLGQLIHDVKAQVPFSAEVADNLGAALRKRNHLMHSFFSTNSVEFVSSPGRAQMIEELRHATEEIEAVDSSLEPITRLLWNRLGMTDEIYEQALNRMLSEAEAQDDSS